MSTTGANVLTSLKNKMQHLREELEKYKDLYDEKCVELEDERSKRNEVCVTAFYLVMSVFTNACQFKLFWCRLVNSAREQVQEKCT